MWFKRSKQRRIRTSKTPVSRTRSPRATPRLRREGFSLSSETKRGVAIIVIFGLAFFSLLSFFEATGAAGETVTSSLGKLFGWVDWLFPVLLLILAYFLLRPATYRVRTINYIGLALVMLSSAGLLNLAVRDVPLSDLIESGRGGGLFGYAAGHYLYQTAAFGGSFIILFALLFIGLFIFFNTSFASIAERMQNLRARMAAWSFRRKTASVGEPVINIPTLPVDADDEDVPLEDDDEPAEKPDLPPRPTGDQQEALFESKRVKKVLPKINLPIDLLLTSTETPASGDIKANMKRIEDTLRSFGITVTMGEVNVGPTVTQYTLKPTEGVKLNQITALHSDLALALAAHPIRIEAPIPGKSLVGIEVPNQSVSLVRLRSVLESPAYQTRKSNLMLSLGQDVTGKSIMADLTRMPHLLIAGATGSGKSVAINCMIISLVYQNSPDELKLILVDPKRVELSNYDHIPHLVAPVITEVDKTINALRWAVHQMDERYKLLQAAGKRNIEAYNNSRLVEKLPYIVIVIDELADLMMVAAKEVESAVIRLAQMARAVGIHLIIATQRPSVNVITGLIKANITSRIAFSVASITDSRTIIDSSGAEKLLGNGDMLFMSAELSKPRRIQGAFVIDEEISRVTTYLREHGEPDYDSTVTERRQNQTGGGTSGYESDDDERDIQEAVRVVVRAQRASATLLQSRMRVGFAKASRILDILEDRDIIGPQNSSKPREVLITQEELDAGLMDEPVASSAVPNEPESESEYKDPPADESENEFTDELNETHDAEDNENR